MISLRTTFLLCLAAALLSTGCVRTNATAPKTYAAKGKVVYSDGTPMTSGFIEFQSVKHPGLRINAEIKKDGTFTLETHWRDPKGKTYSTEQSLAALLDVIKKV